MIELKDISKKFDDHYALKNINLKINKQETVVIIGASGSGKSTLLRIINNLENPTTGSVLINNKKLTQKNYSKLCRKIGMVFQQFNLFPHMNVLKNLTYGPQNILNMAQTEAQNKAKTLLEHFGIEDKLTTLPKNLSGGQKQRVAICRALMMDPETILFDEPTSALDPEIVRDIVRIINELKKQINMIVVTHHIDFARTIADRIIFMDKGLILDDQNAPNFFKKPNSHRARLFLENVHIS